MKDKAKVLEGLAICANSGVFGCMKCPYKEGSMFDSECMKTLMRDAEEVIKNAP